MIPNNRPSHWLEWRLQWTRLDADAYVRNYAGAPEVGTNPAEGAGTWYQSARVMTVDSKRWIDWETYNYVGKGFRTNHHQYHIAVCEDQRLAWVKMIRRCGERVDSSYGHRQRARLEDHHNIAWIDGNDTRKYLPKKCHPLNNRKTPKEGSYLIRDRKIVEERVISSDGTSEGKDVSASPHKVFE